MIMTIIFHLIFSLSLPSDQMRIFRFSFFLFFYEQIVFGFFFFLSFQSFFIVSEFLSIDKNPAPGICLPIIVKFCQNHQVPYNYTIYPNYIGHFSQIEAEEDLEPYEAIVDVQCYELASLFLCTLFVPKCGTAGLIPPCKSLCLGEFNKTNCVAFTLIFILGFFFFIFVFA